MKQNYFLSLCRACMTMSGIPVGLFLFGSCVVQDGGFDPYPVEESRQKENVYYIPSTANAPFLSGKGDLNFNVFRSSGSKYGGLELQTAYAPGKHTGILGSYSHAGNSGSDGQYLKYNRFELGAGYTSESPGGLHVEAYGGLGTGRINNTHHSGSSDVNLSHYFLQPALAISNKKKSLYLGFVSRFAGVHFAVKDTAFNTDREPFSAGQLTGLHNRPFHLMWEPALLFRFGWKSFLFHTGYTYSTDLTDPGLYRSTGNFSLGFSLRFNTLPHK